MSWGKQVRVSLCSPTVAQKNTATVIYVPSLLIHRKLVSGNMWQMDCGKETLMHSVSALCLAQQKQFCKLSTIYASLHLDSLFHFIKVEFGSIHWFNKRMDSLTLRFKHNSEFSMDWLLLWGQDDWFNYTLQQLIYPKCLVLCDFWNELTLLLALCLAACIYVMRQKKESFSHLENYWSSLLNWKLICDGVQLYQPVPMYQPTDVSCKLTSNIRTDHVCGRCGSSASNWFQKSFPLTAGLSSPQFAPGKFVYSHQLAYFNWLYMQSHHC